MDPNHGISCFSRPAIYFGVHLPSISATARTLLHAPRIFSCIIFYCWLRHLVHSCRTSTPCILNILLNRVFRKEWANIGVHLHLSYEWHIVGQTWNVRYTYWYIKVRSMRGHKRRQGHVSCWRWVLSAYLGCAIYGLVPSIFCGREPSQF